MRAGFAGLLLAGAVALPAAATDILYTYAVQAPAPAAAFSDEDLVRTVAVAFAADDLLKGATLLVKVVQGRVVIDGVALSEAQRQQALAVAQYAVGVERVAEPVLELAR